VAGGGAGRERGSHKSDQTHRQIRVTAMTTQTQCEYLHAQYLLEKVWYPHHVNISLNKIEGAEHDGAIKNGVGGPYDEILLFFRCWHWGPYMDPDQQVDMYK
jgi:hypothetical protein